MNPTHDELTVCQQAALSEEEERDAPTLVPVPEQQSPPADEPAERLAPASKKPPSSSRGGSGVSQMRISNTQSGLSSATWEAYSTTKAWSLSFGQGIKTVYVQYRDGAGNRSAVVTDTIRFAR